MNDSKRRWIPLTTINFLFLFYNFLKIVLVSMAILLLSSSSCLRLSPLCSLLFLSCIITACSSFTGGPITSHPPVMAASLPALHLNVLALLQPAPELRGSGARGPLGRGGTCVTKPTKLEPVPWVPCGPSMEG